METHLFYEPSLVYIFFLFIVSYSANLFYKLLKEIIKLSSWLNWVKQQCKSRKMYQNWKSFSKIMRLRHWLNAAVNLFLKNVNVVDIFSF